MLSLRASTHQGDERFQSAGRQCTANSLMAMLWAANSELDKILEDGDTLYQSIGINKFLLISELPKEINNFKMKLSQAFSGTVSREVTDLPFYSLHDALQNIEQFCFLTLDCYTMAVIKTNNKYFLFDSHSRNDCGMPCAEGKAVLTGHSSLRNLVIFVRHLTSVLSTCQEIFFEVNHVLLVKNDCTGFLTAQPFNDSECESDFSGFSAVSEGEYTCKLYLIEQEVNRVFNETEMSDLSALDDQFSDCSDTASMVWECSSESSIGNDDVAGRSVDGSGDAGRRVDGSGDAGRRVDGSGDAGMRVDGSDDAGRSVDGCSDAGRSIDGSGAAGRRVDGDDDAGRSVDGCSDIVKRVDGSADAGKSVHGTGDAGRGVDGNDDVRRSVDGSGGSGRSVDGSGGSGRSVDGGGGSGRSVDGSDDVCRSVDGSGGPGRSDCAGRSDYTGRSVDGSSYAVKRVGGSADAGRSVDSSCGPGRSDGAGRSDYAGRRVDGESGADMRVGGSVDASRSVDGSCGRAGRRVDGGADADRSVDCTGDTGRIVDGNGDAGRNVDGSADASSSVDVSGVAGRSVDVTGDAGRHVDGSGDDADMSVDGNDDVGRSVDGNGDVGRSVDDDVGRSVDGNDDVGRSVDGNDDVGRSVDGNDDVGRSVDGNGDVGRSVDGDVGRSVDGNDDVGRSVDGSADASSSVDVSGVAGRSVDVTGDAGRHVDGSGDDADMSVDGNDDVGRSVDGNGDVGRSVDDDVGRSVDGNGDVGRGVDGNGDVGGSVDGNGDVGKSVDGNGDVGRSVDGNGDAGSSVDGNGNAGRSDGSNDDAGRSVDNTGDAGRSDDGSGDTNRKVDDVFGAGISAYDSVDEHMKVHGSVNAGRNIDGDFDAGRSTDSGGDAGRSGLERQSDDVDRAEFDSMIDESLADLNNSSEFLQSIDIDALGNDSNSDTIDYVISQSDLSDIEENMPLSFVSRKYRKVSKRHSHSRLFGSACKPRTETSVGQSEQPPEQVDTCEYVIESVRGRKRVRDEKNWKVNKNKRRRNEGKSYVNRYGNVIRKRILKPACGARCRFKCCENLSEEDRLNALHSYWQLGCITRQRQFVIKFSHRYEKCRGRKKLTSRRKYSYKYFLPKVSTNSSVRVCKLFFLNTLDIGQSVVATAHSKIKLQGVVEKDGRGRSNGSRVNTVPDDKLRVVRNHIKSFKTIDSHYCRKDTNRQYIDSTLSLQKMYDLYCDYCLSKNLQPVRLHTYRKVFNTEFNISFHKPVNDQCDLCIAFSNATGQAKVQMEDEYSDHIRNSKLAQESKIYDKKRALSDKDVTVACFDLEQVLLTPHGKSSAFFFKRRLNTYNFTIYNLGTRDGHCYVWDETTAGRGSCEIASCVFSFIKQKAQLGCKKFIFYSDNCSAQNKNRYYITMIWYCLQKFNLDYIQHKYLEKGHTFNENDSIHAAVENVTKHLNLYTTSQWAGIIQTARRRHPYKVHEMSLHDFFDFKLLSKCLKNFDLNEEREKVYLSEIRILKVESAEPNKFSLKYDYESSVFKVVCLVSRIRCLSVSLPDPKVLKLGQLRDDYVKITADKYNDLVSLCIDNIIPRANHLFYAMLPHESSIDV